ncbi:hypothetical protein DNTS_005796 [Danionella cerebrum]|uniref:Beta/gamma crystallin 'Greek key' domain-containing protein n=1 Tax=Danionella cerebrum TaxID=2873325 RepID=A0A553PJ05_9TELE|nr:hypothetical protein DNTS_005796 [Danionella translucida]
MICLAEQLNVKHINLAHHPHNAQYTSNAGMKLSQNMDRMGKHTGSFRIRLYERPDFQGQTMECSDDCPSLFERFRQREVHSCNVLDGAWIFFEQPNFRGRQYLLERGEYRCFTDWNAMHPTVGSIRRIQDF